MKLTVSASLALISRCYNMLNDRIWLTTDRQANGMTPSAFGKTRFANDMTIGCIHSFTPVFGVRCSIHTFRNDGIGVFADDVFVDSTAVGFPVGPSHHGHQTKAIPQCIRRTRQAAGRHYKGKGGYKSDIRVAVVDVASHRCGFSISKSGWTDRRVTPVLDSA